MLLNQFLDYLKYEKRYSPHTLSAYERDLQQLEEFFLTQNLHLFSPDQLAAITHRNLRTWALYLIEKGQSPKTLRRKLSSARTYFNFTQKKGHSLFNPAEKINLPKLERNLPSFLKEDEIRQLLDGLSFEDSMEGKRDRCILELLYGCGLRRSELLGLGLEDIDLFAQKLKVKGKGGKERIIPFGRPAKAAIEVYLSELHQRGFYDKSCLILRKNGLPAYPKLIYNVVYKYIGQVSSLKQKGPHVLRHTYATHMLDQGADLNAIKELLGHKSLASTQVYTHNSIAKLKEVYQQAHPRADKHHKH